MVPVKDPVVMAMDKREAIAVISWQIEEKWKLKFKISEKMDRIQKTFDEVGKRVCFGKKDRVRFPSLNQILCGHSRLNRHQPNMNPNQYKLCDKCKVSETVEHYLSDCNIYMKERKELEESAEAILSRE